MAGFGNKPPREVLHAHEGRREGTGTGKEDLGPRRARDCKRHACDPAVSAPSSPHAAHESSAVWPSDLELPMKSLRMLLFRARALFRGERLDAEMREAIEHHLAMRAAAAVANGAPPADGRYSARRAFGSVEKI